MDAAVSKPSSPPSRRSCQTCASAKVRCTQSDPNEDTKCDRCRRLNKDCALQPVMERKPRARRKTTRVAQLEQKLDGLVSLLTSKENGQHSPYQSPESLPRAGSVQSPATTFPGAYGTEGVGTATSPRLGPLTQDAGHCFRTIAPSMAQQYLQMFQTKMSTYFPFVVIPPEVTAERLRLERPSLFGAVVVAASFSDIKQQTLYGESLLRHFIEEILIKGEKNLDLLQGLLIYICWYHFISHLKKRLTQLISMASALVTDLGLARAQPVNERLTITMDDTKGTYGCNSHQGVRTLEERRAYTGVFYIASCVSACFRELHTIRLTAYLEDCCSALESAAEYPTDQYLVQLTRLQAMVERISHAFQYGTRSASPRVAWKIPIVLYIAPFDREFDTFLDKLSPELRENNLLMMHYYNARGYLYEIALYEPPQMAHYNHPSFRRMEMLYACLQTIKTFYGYLDQIPPDLYYYVPMMHWTQVTHSLVNLSKLCFLDAEDWSVSHARQVLDLSKLLDYVAGRFEEARSVKNSPPEPDDYESDLFSRFARRMRIIKTKYDKRIADENALADAQVEADGAANLNQQQQQQQQQMNGINTTDGLANMDNDDFWRDLIGEWTLPQFQPPMLDSGSVPCAPSPQKKRGFEHATCSAAVS